VPSRRLLHTRGLIFFSLIICGTLAYVHTYILTLEYFDKRTTSPFTECARFLNLAGGTAGVFTAHPDLLATYYKGPIYKLPEKGGFEGILQEAKEKGVRYLLIESTCINSKELIDLYYQSVYPRQGRIPSEFQLVKAEKGVYGLYSIGPEEEQQVWFKAAIFSHLQWGEARRQAWETMLTLLGASTSTFGDTTIISSVDITEFDVVVFDDFKRLLNDAERSYLEESVQNGLTIIVSGLSPSYLAGGTKDLTGISSWFGATVFSEAPKEARWKVKFTEDAKEIIKGLDLNQEYAFYTDSDWSTPTACLAQLESIVYAYRVNDQAATIFSYKFGKGNIIFNGPRFGFLSQDAGTFVAFLRALILSALVQTSSH